MPSEPLAGSGEAVGRGLARAGVQTLFIAQGSPRENGYVESFNSVSAMSYSIGNYL